MKFQKNLDRYQEMMTEMISFFLIKPSHEQLLKVAGMNFNWGIIWKSLSPLIIIAGWTLLFTIGIKGQGYDLEYFAFLLLFGLGFTNLVSRISNFQLNPIFFNKKNINIINSSIALYLSEFYMLLVRFFILILTLKIFNFNLAYYHLTCGLLLIALFGFFYGVFINAIFNRNKFLIDIHGYFLQAVFLSSSIIIPVTILPPSIRNIFLYNPLVHINEWIKSATTGIYFDYINMIYPIKFIVFFTIISPIFFWLVNKNQYLNKI